MSGMKDLSGKLRFSPRILRNKDANHTNSPGCFRRRNKTVHGDRVIFMAMFVTALIANTFAATIRTASIRQVENFLYSFIAGDEAVQKILDLTDGRGTDCGCECVGYQCCNKHGHEDNSVTMNSLVASTKATGGIGVVGVFIPQDPGAESELAREVLHPAHRSAYIRQEPLQAKDDEKLFCPDWLYRDG